MASAEHQAPRPSQEALFSAPPMNEVRIGYVGVGGMGSAHVRNLLKVPGARITAICDIVEDKVKRMQKLVVDAGQPEPRGYSRGPRDFERLCEAETLDLVYTATPWEWHVPVCVSAMKNGKHAATEVPAAMTIDDCWQLVEHAEKYRKHCVMMENCNYGRAEMMVFHMIRKGLLGEILHGEGGYLHDLREIKFSSEGEGLWRRAHAMKRNGNLYPTHGLGPIANCMDINRGDRFEYLVSMSGPSRGLQDYAKEHFPEGSAAAGREVRARRRQRQPDPHGAGPHVVRSATTRTCRGRTAASISSRARAGSFRDTRIVCTSKGGARSTAGKNRARISPSSTIRCGPTSRRTRKAPATAAWTISRTTG